MDIGEYLAQFRDKRVMLIIAPIGEAGPDNHICGICGFAMTVLEDCPRCEMQNEQTAKGLRQKRSFLSVSFQKKWDKKGIRNKGGFQHSLSSNGFKTIHIRANR